MLASASFSFCSFHGWQKGGLLCSNSASSWLLLNYWSTVYYGGGLSKAWGSGKCSWSPLPFSLISGWLCLKEIGDVFACRFSWDISGVIQWIMQGFHSSPHWTHFPITPTEAAELLLIGLTSGTALFWGNPILHLREEFPLKSLPCLALSIHLALQEWDKWKSNSPRPRKQLLSPACHCEAFDMFIIKLSGWQWEARIKAAKYCFFFFFSTYTLDSFLLAKNILKLMEVGWAELVITTVHARHSVRNTATHRGHAIPVKNPVQHL